jgi:hypothetical protein
MPFPQTETLIFSLYEAANKIIIQHTHKHFLNEYPNFFSSFLFYHEFNFLTFLFFS